MLILRNLLFAGIMRSMVPRPGLVDLHVPSRLKQVNNPHLRETSGPGPSGAGRWPEPQPFAVRVGSRFWT